MSYYVIRDNQNGDAKLASPHAWNYKEAAEMEAERQNLAFPRLSPAYVKAGSEIEWNPPIGAR